MASFSYQYASMAEIEEAATISPPLPYHPDLTIFHAAITDWVVEQRGALFASLPIFWHHTDHTMRVSLTSTATQTESWEEFRWRHVHVEKYTSQARFRAAQTGAMKRFYWGYTGLLYSLVCGRSRELQKAMQIQIDVFSLTVQEVDVWRFSEHLPLVLLKGMKDVQMMINALDRPGLRFKRQDGGRSTSSARRQPVATDSNADRAHRTRSHRHD
ncbi:hypothetical protein DENSPDRAFT_535667 [Dentipellis sp. KUC8613]|nr:hypothetical protein DENSPDRAFT_535667 [Dentipellis sp. KUC8613]